jgi:hypothetical protein
MAVIYYNFPRTLKRLRVPVTILVLILVAVFVSREIGFSSRANPTHEPKSLRITNVSDNSFTVSWVTADKATTGSLIFGLDEPIQAEFDDRDAGQITPRHTHHVTVNNLEPSTAYLFKIVSDNDIFTNNGVPWEAQTAPTTESTPPTPETLFGHVDKDDGTVSDDALIFATVGTGTPISTYTRSDGNWLLTLNNARATDLASYVPITEETAISLTVRAAGFLPVIHDLRGSERRDRILTVVEAPQ